jgi:hypothetical protein
VLDREAGKTGVLCHFREEFVRASRRNGGRCAPFLSSSGKRIANHAAANSSRWRRHPQHEAIATPDQHGLVEHDGADEMSPISEFFDETTTYSRTYIRRSKVKTKACSRPYGDITQESNVGFDSRCHRPR